MKKRLLSLLLAFSMMLTFLPVGALPAMAADDMNENITLYFDENGKLDSSRHSVTNDGEYTSDSWSFTYKRNCNSDEFIIFHQPAYCS